MGRPWRWLLLLVAMFRIQEAKVINAGHNEAYANKLYAGVSQALQWITQMITLDKPHRPPKKVKLALVGFGRTGSTSFATALKDLKYTPVHDDEMTEVADVYGDMMSGALSMDQAQAELGKRGFDAPMITTHKFVEWAATAPDIKVIVTTRDKTKWAQSWLAITPVATLLEHRPWKWLKVAQDIAAFQLEIMVNVPTNGKPELYEDIPTLEAGYDAWLEFVRQTVPAERLLEFDVKQGWEPLCKFLGEPVPQKPFPYINDRVVIDTIVKVFVWITWIWPVVLMSPLLLLWCCFRCCCRKQGKADLAATKKHA